MKYPVNITSLALQDIASIFEHIAVKLHEPETAVKIKDDILDAIDTLETFPSRNKPFDDKPYHSREIRRLIVKHYYVIYQIRNDSVLMLRVIYNRRDWKNTL